MQVRNLDPSVQETLKSLALKQGVSFSEFLRRELTRMAERERVRSRWEEVVVEHEARLERLRNAPPESREPINIDTQTIVDIIHESRRER